MLSHELGFKFRVCESRKLKWVLKQDGERNSEHLAKHNLLKPLDSTGCGWRVIMKRFLIIFSSLGTKIPKNMNAFLFSFIFFKLKLIYNIVVVSGIQLMIHIYVYIYFFIFFSILV